MPQPFPVILAPYDPDWPVIASRHAARLQILGPTLVIAHHIGSTSVPGLTSKPIIDLMPLVPDLAELDRQQACVESLGYQWHGEYGIPGRRYWTLPDEAGNRVVQLHFFQADSPDVPRHLAFRDYLRAHPGTARDYETEKRRAQKLYPNDVHAYTDEKAAWIKRTEEAALLWFARNG
jgi:GrpB-like predicted nucleotidyltransferase (UPF0157 family)